MGKEGRGGARWSREETQGAGGRPVVAGAAGRTAERRVERAVEKWLKRAVEGALKRAAEWAVEREVEQAVEGAWVASRDNSQLTDPGVS